MKRGVSQTIAFSFILALAIFLQMGALAVFLVPLWLYSFFDAYNLRRQRLDMAPPEDAYLFGLSDMDSRRLRELMGRRHSLIGWGLVALGLFALWQNLAHGLYRLFDDFFGGDDWWLYNILMYDIPRIFITLLVIALGIWFIRGPRKKSGDSIPEFTPPEEPFTAKGPYSPEAQVPVTLRLDPEGEESEPAAAPKESETREEAHDGSGC